MSLFNFGSICIFAVKLRFFGKKGLSSIFFVPLRKKLPPPMQTCIKSTQAKIKQNETVLAKRWITSGSAVSQEMGLG